MLLPRLGGRLAARARVPPARLPFAPLSARPLSRRAAAPALRVASDGNGGLVPARPGQEAEDAAATARGAVSERAARKESERRTYLVAALMSSLGITSMAAAAVYYRFAWQMEVPFPPFSSGSPYPWQFPFQFPLLYRLVRSHAFPFTARAARFR